MVDRVEQRFAIKPKRLVGDTAYGTGAMLGWMVQEKGIDPHVPVWQRPPRNDGTFPNSDFHWIERSDEYRCPAGHALRKERRPFKAPRSHITKAGTIIYRSSQTDCASCLLKDQCCPNTPMRKIARSVHEDAREQARAIANTPAYKRSRRQRKKVEMLFAHLKRILKLDRLRLRGRLSLPIPRKLKILHCAFPACLSRQAFEAKIADQTMLQTGNRVPARSAANP